MLNEQITVPTSKQGKVKLSDASERVKQEIPSYMSEAEDLLKFAAHFLVLVGEPSVTGDRFKEVAAWLVQNAPFDQQYFEEDGRFLTLLNSGKFDEQEGVSLYEASIKDLTDEEAEALDNLLSPDEREREEIIRKIKRELESPATELDDILRLLKKVPAQTPTQPIRRQASLDKFDRRVYDIIVKSGTQPDYFDKLKEKFYKYVNFKFQSLGKDVMFSNNKGLSARGREYDFKGTNNDIKTFLEDDGNFEFSLANNTMKELQNAMETIVPKTAVNEGAKLVFDLNEAKEQALLNEGFMSMFRTWVKLFLKYIFGDVNIPMSITGNPGDVEAFAQALKGEKRYIDSIRKHGLNNKQTYNSRSQLAKSIRSFESETGLKWPFK